MGRGGAGDAGTEGAPPKRYRLLTPDGFVYSDIPGRFSGVKTMKIFGRHSCRSGMRAKPENHVFFADWETAVACGYRPCKNCRPQPDDQWQRDPAGRWQLIRRDS